PGTVGLGYGIIRVEGKKLTCLTLDALKLDPKKDPFDRLADIHAAVAELFATYHPDHMAMEAPFFGKNIQSMLKLGRAQGVIMSAGLSAGIPVLEYSPRKVKQAITGNGAASKEQVSGMLQHIYGLESMPKVLDATDGLAVATCHAYAIGSPIQASMSANKLKKAPKGKGKGSWSQFLSQNPDRLQGGKSE
ncbi:MAG TPA: crossover junction endodeoxyribonuclease RuvC, partial [Cryomorphaceae bacterium]|nr:crossover junction endodeoxyribonuclease RuvC [Cryomorphaceae bacterium]